MIRTAFAPCLLAVFIVISGCVSERRVVAPERPRDPRAERRATSIGPVVTPAPNAHAQSSRIVVGVQPIGSVPYDAQVLPVISPDGRFLATQTGDAPNWPTLLAEGGPRLTLGTKLRIYDISGRAPKEIKPSKPLPPSLLLGRSATARGFLVESPQLDGSRHLGFISWDSGQLHWIADDNSINAFATYNSRGDLVWMSRRESEPPTLKVRTISGRTIEQSLSADITRVYPVFGSDPSTLMLFELTEQGIDLAARKLGSSALGPTISRRRIADINDPFLVYQSLIAIQSPQSARNTDGRFTFLHPTTGRITLFDHTTGALTPLVERSIASAPINDGASPGLVLTTPQGLVYQRLPRNATGNPLPATRLLEGDHVPRATNDPRFPIILISPSKNAPGRVSLTRINLPEDAP